MTRNTISRSLHDLGLSAWFGGTLANAVALNPAAAKASGASDVGAVANTGWDRWTPVNAAAIGAHLIGSLGQIGGNKARIKDQQGVASMALAKTGLTAAALGVTAWSGALGAKLAQHGPEPVEGGTVPASETPKDVADAQRQLHVTQWLIPGLTAAIAEARRGAPHRARGGLACRT